MTSLQITVPVPYDFDACLRGHGWRWLAPFSPNEEGVTRVERLQSGRVIQMAIREGEEGETVRVHVDQPLTEAEETELKQEASWMLRLDEDLAPFYEMCVERGGRYAAVIGHGRLLRSPTLFEDAVKVLFTTNTTWRQTKQMTARTVEGLGAPHPTLPETAEVRHAFPEPAAVMEAGVAFFRDHVRAGYRADYVVALAERAEELEALRERASVEDALPTDELRKRLLSFRGIGPYAAATLLMLLGRYDYLAIDSEVRAFTSRHYFDGRTGSNAEIRALYEVWGPWKYLAYALDSGPGRDEA
ncbi:MAG: hypothetical protein R3272_07450 [Candidatus Promineifilaceae bacterium]|nr:hypothetical protein [Candidatus Promineifilaceae bacterium]